MEKTVADLKMKADRTWDRYEALDMDVTISDVESAYNLYNLAEDALLYLRHWYNGNDCTCRPTDVTACHFCRLKRRYDEYMKQTESEK